MTRTMAQSKKHISLFIRERNPVNLEYPFEQLDDFMTPKDLFYIRRHFKAHTGSRQERAGLNADREHLACQG